MSKRIEENSKSGDAEEWKKVLRIQDAPSPEPRTIHGGDWIALWMLFGSMIIGGVIGLFIGYSIGVEHGATITVPVMGMQEHYRLGDWCIILYPTCKGIPEYVGFYNNDWYTSHICDMHVNGEALAIGKVYYSCGDGVRWL